MRTALRTAALALAVSAVVAALALVIIFRFLMPKDETQTPAPPYTIGVWEGKVAVFEGDDAFPMQVFDDAVDGLPPKQRDEVTRGIAVHDPEELYAILEDYTS
ncbi:MAG: hypothetical protein IJB26_03750 [Clostridia bacterium]|nr:hypothetical protein [Clostridia bacterium]